MVGLVVPQSTPADVVGKLNKAVVTAINDPTVHKRLVDFGVEPVGSTPEQYGALVASENARWHKLIHELKITLD